MQIKLILKSKVLPWHKEGNYLGFRVYLHFVIDNDSDDSNH